MFFDQVQRLEVLHQGSFIPRQVADSAAQGGGAEEEDDLHEGRSQDLCGTYTTQTHTDKTQNTTII